MMGSAATKVESHQIPTGSYVCVQFMPAPLGELILSREPLGGRCISRAGNFVKNRITLLLYEVSAEKSRVTLGSSFGRAKRMRGWPSASIRSTVPARLRAVVEVAAESPEELVPREESDHHRVV